MVFLNFAKIYFFTRLIFSLDFQHCNALPPQPRLSIADYSFTNYRHYEPEGPGTYAFGYDVDDPETENVQFREEARHPNGTVSGSYGYVMPDGNVHMVRYVADEGGYRAVIGEPFGDLGRSSLTRNELDHEIVEDSDVLENNSYLTKILSTFKKGHDDFENDKMSSTTPHRFFIPHK